MLHVWPRSIRWKFLARLLILEALSVLLLAGMLTYQESREVNRRVHSRLAHQADSIALQAQDALLDGRPAWIGLSVRMMGEAPSVASVKVTDPAGVILFASRGQPKTLALSSQERAQIPLFNSHNSMVFESGSGYWEGAKPIYLGNDLRGYAWIESDRGWDREQLNSILRTTFAFAIIWIVASAVLALLVARSITGPLAVLQRGTGSLMTSPEGIGSFPLPVAGDREVSELIEAFNRMVASLTEQRAGLDDTLSQLDSMLTNAPVGIALFDRNCRFVRLNQVFAGLSGLPVSRHLGKTMPELLPQPLAQKLEDAVLRVLLKDEAIRAVEIVGRPDKQGRSSTWIANVYPVHTSPGLVRWAGVIALDTTERKLTEEALRKTEKLAAAGRLAASIAHEINNPLEAITNLLFLLHNYSGIEGSALEYVQMAELEAQRISAITQQTLRFYRQTTLPSHVRVGDLIDSVLTLYHGRLSTAGVRLELEVDPAIDLFCFAGELRQVLSNLVGNAIDASANGARLLIRAHRSQSWSRSRCAGVRFAVADTGAGMEPEVRARAFEAFFTTKDVTGTGLGLWVTHEIVHKHGGQIHLRSRSGRPGRSSGTVFQIFIPNFENRPRPEDAAQPAVA